jgi:L-amino acid N-acyltransferase YncA
VTEVVIRDAGEEDWPAIWPLIREVAAARETYTYPEDIDERTAKDIWTGPANSRVLVAVSADGRVLGTAKMGPNQRGPGAHMASASFMVSADARGLGVGRALGEAVLVAARAAGFRAMQFNAVVETNAPAVKLWRSLGFDIIGTVPEAFNHATLGLVGLHVMHRRLD